MGECGSLLRYSPSNPSVIREEVVAEAAKYCFSYSEEFIREEKRIVKKFINQ